MRGDWGFDLPESDFDAPFEWSVDTDEPEELPSVIAAARLGYEPAPEAPIYAFLPAVWPNEFRAWVRDIRIRHGMASTSEDAHVHQRTPWSTWDYFEFEDDYNQYINDCGLPPRPPGRLWLLRPPPGFASLNDTLQHFSDTATAAGLFLEAQPAYAERVSREIANLFP